MIVRKSNLRLRAERGPGSRRREDIKAEQGPASALENTVRTLVSGKAEHRRRGVVGELAEIPLPDLLSPAGGPGPDPESLANLLDLAFLGRASTGELDRELNSMDAGATSWVPEHFRDDLFLTELVRGSMDLRVCSRRLKPHRGFLEQVLCNPPTNVATVRFRQAILRELEHDSALCAHTDELLDRILRLLKLLRAARDDARLEPVRFRLDVLRGFRAVVELMTDGFADAESGLQRLHIVGREIFESKAFQHMAALLDHQSGMATLELGAVIGADGKLRHLEIHGLRELKKNPYFRRPLRRWWDRLRIFYHRYSLDAEVIVDRLVQWAYQGIAPALARAVQLAGPLELYVASRSMAADAHERGLPMCLPEVDSNATLKLDGLFNPLLMSMMERPVPSDLRMTCTSPTSLVTGPNSGGKTRLLQAVGIAQVLGQSGLYVPCSAGKLPLVAGLFASIVEVDRADQSEGRLGTELMRLRTLFETVPTGSLILLDELCSGTNPSEAIEIVETVLRLLKRIDPVAFVTTHFLDFAEQLRAQPSSNGLGFLQAEVDAESGATYRFVPGVADTSLAVGTAQRLGVTFEELERRLAQRETESD